MLDLWLSGVRGKSLCGKNSAITESGSNSYDNGDDGDDDDG